MLILRPRRAAFDQWSKEASVRAVRRAPTLIDTTLKWGVFAWLMILVWGSAAFWIAVVAFLILLG